MISTLPNTESHNSSSRSNSCADSKRRTMGWPTVHQLLPVAPQSANAEPPGAADDAPRLWGKLRYQHPWSYFPQWVLLVEAVRDALAYRPNQVTENALALLLVYPLYVFGLALFFLVAVPVFVLEMVPATPVVYAYGVMRGLKWTERTLSQRAKRKSSATPYSGVRDSRRIGSTHGNRAGFLMVVAFFTLQGYGLIGAILFTVLGV